MRILKWYLDCVSPAGEAIIVYVGRVEMACLTIPYFEVFSVGSPPPIARLKRLSKHAVVGAHDRILALDATPFGISGRWTARCPAVEAVLLESSRGRIVWRCHQPAADVTLRLPGEVAMSGSGYAEELDMTCPPWALPCDEVRWGRFVGDSHSAVWIDWRGGLERRWLFVGGQPRAAPNVSRERVEWDGGAIQMDPDDTIRDGRIGPEVAGPLARLLPRRLANATETKWLSRAHLHEADGTTSRGWAIHEVVRWA